MAINKKITLALVFFVTLKKGEGKGNREEADIHL